jgi:hypothetical protein
MRNSSLNMKPLASKQPQVAGCFYAHGIFYRKNSDSPYESFMTQAYSCVSIKWLSAWLPSDV